MKKLFKKISPRTVIPSKAGISLNNYVYLSGVPRFREDDGKDGLLQV